jgi:hypothetical protein
MKLEDLYRIRLELNGAKFSDPNEKKFIEPNPCWEGYEAIGLKDDGTPNCVPIKEEQSKVKEGFPVPSPNGDEDEDTFIGRCMKEIGGEYEQEQALAICYKKYEDK